MKMKSQKSIVLKRNMKNRPKIPKRVSNRGIKSTIKRKILPNRFNKRQNIPKRVSNRGIKSLENNFSVKATKKIINTPKIVIEKPQIVAKPEIVTMSKIVAKPEIVDRPEIVNRKYKEYKKHVIKQLKKKLFDT